MRGRFPQAAAVIFGHSHLPLHERAADGFHIFNPGSPTERRRAPQRTMGLAHLGSGLIEFELVELVRRVTAGLQSDRQSGRSGPGRAVNGEEHP